MRRINFSFRGRIRNLNLGSWKHHWERRRNMQYYINKPRDDGRNPVAKWLDFYGSLLTLWLVSVIMIFTFIEKPSTALVISALILIMSLTVARFIRKARGKRMLHHRRMYLAGKRCLKDIEGLTAREELSEFICMLLTERPNFKKVCLNAQEKGKKLHNNIALTAVYKDTPVAIQCCPVNTKPVDTGIINSFVDAMEEQGYKCGIIATPGKFSREARQLVEILSNRYRLQLLEGFQLVEMARQARHRIYPDNEMDMKLKEDNKTLTGRSQGALLKHSALAGRRQGFRYLFSALFLLSVYMIFSSSSPYSIIYFIFIGINIALASACFISAGRKQGPIEEI